MAAGLAVVVSDWNGYKDTVRHEVDGLRVPTVLPPPLAGEDLTTRLALYADDYDMHVGRTSLSTVVDPQALAQALSVLMAEPALRERLAASAQARARQDYDWSVVLPRYEALALELNAMRMAAARTNTHPALGQETMPPMQPLHWPARKGPFERFAHFASHTLGGDWRVEPGPDAAQRLVQMQALVMANYADAVETGASQHRAALLQCCSEQPGITVNKLLMAAEASHPQGVRSLMWLWKFDLIRVRP